MGEVKNQIQKLVAEAGSKFKARKAAEEWFVNGKGDTKEKGVSSISKRFFPGKLYVFRYAPIGINSLPWYDANPMVLALDPDGINDVGINLNLLPTEGKEDLLDKVYGQFSAEIARNSIGPLKNDAVRQSHLSFNWNDAKGSLKGPGFDFALRQYKPGGKANQAVVSYENWGRMALCAFADLQGTSRRELMSLFRKR